MRFGRMRNIIKTPLVLVVFLMPLLCLWFVNMDMSAMDGKASCPFGGHLMAICQMNPLEHIQEWQSMFTMLPAQNILFTFFALFAFLFAPKSGSRFSLSKLLLIFSSNRLLRSQSFQIFDPLKQAFSNGILNPKVF